ncbi:MAG: chain length determinant protein (polysaccharide antigen chain regulator) [Oleispira sp.]|jgi:chain length determinant protein (polysaccharide antigen chain regulator)
MNRVSDSVSEVINQDSIAQQHSSNDDEIDLFDLIDDIWNQKSWVFAGLLVTIILAGLYVFKVTPVYQAEAKVKWATVNDLIEFARPQLQGGDDVLKEGGDAVQKSPQPIFEMTVESAFSSATAALLSTGYRKAFYELKLDDIKAIPDAYNEGLTLEQNFSHFSEQFSVKTSGTKDTESFVQLSLKSSDAIVGVALLNEFIEYALSRRLRDSYNTMLARVNGRIEALNYDINIIRKEYFGNKVRRILELKEAANIALAVGQENPVYRNMDLVGGQLPPLYMLGFKAIKAEIKALESREQTAKDLARGEDHFIAGLPKLLVEIEALQALEIDFSKISLARIDEVAVVPVSPIKPRKLLIMALALVGGLFAGLFMALVVAAYSKHKIRSLRMQAV